MYYIIYWLIINFGKKEFFLLTKIIKDYYLAEDQKKLFLKNKNNDFKGKKGIVVCNFKQNIIIV